MCSPLFYCHPQPPLLNHLSPCPAAPRPPFPCLRPPFTLYNPYVPSETHPVSCLLLSLRSLPHLNSLVYLPPLYSAHVRLYFTPPPLILSSTSYPPPLLPLNPQPSHIYLLILPVATSPPLHPSVYSWMSSFSPSSSSFIPCVLSALIYFIYLC